MTHFPLPIGFIKEAMPCKYAVHNRKCVIARPDPHGLDFMPLGDIK